jgi:hypothetical protein
MTERHACCLQEETAFLTHAVAHAPTAQVLQAYAGPQKTTEKCNMQQTACEPSARATVGAWLLLLLLLRVAAQDCRH